MNKSIIIIGLIFLTNCGKNKNQEDLNTLPPVSSNSEKIKVLNFATFHMGTTSDASSVDFDEKDKKNQEDAQQIAQLIAQFKPTIICVETPREKNQELNNKYQNYLNDPSKISTYYGEVGLVAFEVGRIGEITQLHAIDHKMNYNYRIYNEIVNEIDSITVNEYYANPFKSAPELNVSIDTLSLLDKLKLMNSPKFLDYLIVVNADMLAFAGTENGYEGADEAAKYYQRNLRIYSNLNRIPMTKEDRVFILSGGSHTAFLNEFMERSPIYEVVNTMDYLK
ncbi:MAG: hypothetical protein ACI87N_002161 [Flavobacteriales bacterium]|jgi:hypothetical protein